MRDEIYSWLLKIDILKATFGKIQEVKTYPDMQDVYEKLMSDLRGNLLSHVAEAKKFTDPWFANLTVEDLGIL